MPVLAIPHLQRIGQVREVLLDSSGTQILGLLLAEGGFLQGRRILDYLAVESVETTHVLAAERYIAPSSHTVDGQRLHGRPVLRPSGEEVGLLDDFHFDPATGQITALQLSHGLVDDLLKGKEIVALTGPVVTREAAILLEDWENFREASGVEVPQL
jgi:uncharacterized protein YrrD